MVNLEVLADTDGDGMPNTWEQSHGLSTTVNDASDDSDNDQQTNLAEFLSGTNPGDPGSVLTSSATTASELDVLVEWQSVPGRRYRVLYSPDLITWTPLTNSEHVASGLTSTYLHVNGLSTTRYYYRVETAPAFP